MERGCLRRWSDYRREMGRGFGEEGVVMYILGTEK